MKAKLLGIIGSIALIVGVFLPIVKISNVQVLNYFECVKGDGSFIFFLGFISLFLSLFGRSNLLGLIILLSGGTITYFFIILFNKEINISVKVGENITYIPFKELTSVYDITIQLEYGWVILFVGIFLLLLSTIIGMKYNKNLDY